MAMSDKDKRMAAMKRRFSKTQPSKNIGQSFMQRIKNDMFGKSKSMGIDDDVKGLQTQEAKSMLSKLKNKKKTGNKDTRLSPGALGGKIKIASKTDKKIKPTVKKDTKKIVKAAPKTDSKSKVKATAGNTKNFASTMAMQKKLIAKGAKIKADGIMGPKTRAAMAKFMKPMDKPKSRPSKTMVDSFKKSNVSANKNKKAGTDSAPQDNTKQKNFKKNTNPKLDSMGNYKGTDFKPTKLQLDRMNKRRAKKGST